MWRWARAFGGDAREARDVDTVVRSALLATLDRDFDRAERKLRDAVRLDSDAVAPYQALARLFRQRGEVGRAIRIHQNLLMRADLRTKEGVELLADLAADFQQGGFLRRAIASYEEVLAHDRRHRGALRALVRLLAGVHEYPRAIQMNRRLTRLEREGGGTREAQLRVEMANAARADERSGDALRAVKKALRKDPGCVDAWFTLHERFGALPMKDVLAPAIRYAGEGVPVPETMARALAARGDVDESSAELRFALEHDPNDLQLRTALGRILLSESRDLEASKEHEALLEVLERRRSRERFE